MGHPQLITECTRFGNWRPFCSGVKKANLQVIAQYLVAHLSYTHVPTLSNRHKVEVKKDSDSAQELLSKQVSTYDNRVFPQPASTTVL